MGYRRELFLATGSEHSTFAAFHYALDLVRKRHPHMSVGTLSTFLYIADYRGPTPLTATDIAVRLGISIPTVFSQCDQLSDGIRGKNGMKLLQKVPHPDDARARTLKLTFSGLQLLTELYDIIEPIDDEPLA